MIVLAWIVGYVMVGVGLLLATARRDVLVREMLDDTLEAGVALFVFALGWPVLLLLFALGWVGRALGKLAGRGER